MVKRKRNPMIKQFLETSVLVEVPNFRLQKEYQRIRFPLSVHYNELHYRSLPGQSSNFFRSPLAGSCCKVLKLFSSDVRSAFFCSSILCKEVDMRLYISLQIWMYSDKKTRSSHSQSFKWTSLVKKCTLKWPYTSNVTKKTPISQNS